MYRVKISEDLINKVDKELQDKNLGKRQSGFNGNSGMQRAGMIGEAYVKDVLGMDFRIKEIFDGGYDFDAGQHKIDIKVQVWSGEVKENYTSTVPLSQIKYDSTGYIFCVYDARQQELTICGAVSKQALVDYGTFFRCGDTTGFGLPSKVNHWGTPYGNLKYINSDNDLIELVRDMKTGQQINFY